jgi:sulfate adenylyltransferase
MSLVEDDRVRVAPPPGPAPAAPAAPSALGVDHALPDLVLGPLATADLMLALAGVLPPGQVLGGPVDESLDRGDDEPGGEPGGNGEPREIGVVLPTAEAVAAALASGGVVLRDEEHTPLAALEQPRVAPGTTPVVRGIPRPLRARESGVGARTTVDFDDPALRGRPLLFLERPPVEADLPVLRAWAQRQARPPVVLVPEHGDGRAWVPTRLLLRLAEHLVAALGTSGVTVRTVPLEPHDPRSDSALVERIARRLGAGAVTSLSDTSPLATAGVWARAHDALVEGRAPGPLPGLDPATERALRAWLPRRGERGVALMFSGLSGSGKSTLARDVAAWLGARTSRTVTLLDGDRVRQMLSAGLGFDQASRELNVRRIGYVAAEIARHGGIAICSPIAPFAQTRAEVRHMVEQSGDFVLVHVSTPLEECERRDLKGLYAKAREGRIPEFTGISSPYDVPTDADLSVDTSALSREEAAQLVIDHLTRGGWVEAGAS